MATCMLCGKQDGPRVCDECKQLTGVREMPPARRRVAPCARCNHSRLIRVIPRELSVESGRLGNARESNLAASGPMFATYTFRQEAKTGIFDEPGTFRVHPPQADEGFGMFEAYICKRCGFVDWYCHDPENIPISPGYMTEEIDSDAAEPYR